MTNKDFINSLISNVGNIEFPSDNMNYNVIFLDFDGVLNSSEFAAHLYRNNESAQDEKGLDLFDPQTIDCMNRIVDATGAKIVVTSSWRYLGLAKLQELWKERGLHGEIIGMTSLHVVDELILEKGLEWLEEEMNNSPRSEEIAHWLKSYNIKANYVILDDLPMPKDFQPHAVQVNPKVGLTDIEVKQAIQKTVIALAKDPKNPDHYHELAKYYAMSKEYITDK